MRKIDFQDGHHGGGGASWISDPYDFSYFWSKSPWCFRPNFESIGLSVQEKLKLDFQDGHHDSQLGFLIKMILAIVHLQVTLTLPIKFWVNWSFGSEEAKNRFSRWLPWRPSWTSDRKEIQLFLIYKSSWCFLHIWRNWPFGSGEAKNIFSMRRPSWIFDRNNFSYFCSTSHPDASYQVLSQLAFWFRRRQN